MGSTDVVGPAHGPPQNDAGVELWLIRTGAPVPVFGRSTVAGSCAGVASDWPGMTQPFVSSVVTFSMVVVSLAIGFAPGVAVAVAVIDVPDGGVVTMMFTD